MTGSLSTLPICKESMTPRYGNVAMVRITRSPSVSGRWAMKK